MRRLVFLFVLFLAGAAAAEQRPNVLLLMAEDMSTRVGAFGDPVARTPNLDTLAAQGVRYERVFTTSGVCSASRAAHILGMHQTATGTQHHRTFLAPVGDYRSVPPAHAKAYPEWLRAAGYYTYTGAKLDYQFSGPRAGSGPFTIWDEEDAANTAWRQRAPGQPFFGFVSFGETHEGGVMTPLGHMPNSFMHFAMQLIRRYKRGAAPPSVTDPASVLLPPYYPDTPIVRADVARHYDNIAAMDASVGAVLRELRADDLADDTVVIWTTDHGDGLPRGKREMYDSGIRVPMIIRWPERFRPAGVAPGAVDARLISFVDLAPTVLALANVEAPDHLHGHDFGSSRDPIREYVYAARDRVDEVTDRQRAVRDHRFKYIRSWYPEMGGGHPLDYRDNIDMMRDMRALYEAGELNPVQRLWFEAPGEEQLYDLQNDPHEVNNLASDPSYSAELQRLRAALEAHLARTGDWSDVPEAEMAAGFLLDGEPRVTPAPEIELRNGRLTLTSSEKCASLGYRVDGGPWRLYSVPVRLEAGEVQARAECYGWEPSEVVLGSPSDRRREK